MKSEKIIYQILKTLEKGVHNVKFKGILLSPEKLNISSEQWYSVIDMLLQDGFIRGVRIFEDVTGEMNVDIENIGITVKGIEYLNENSTMKEMGKKMTNVITIAKTILK